MHVPLLQRLMVWGIRVTVARHRLGVAIVALNDEEQVLLLRHVFHPQTPWGLPGGWLSRREAPADGALRELREETGLTAALEAPVLITREAYPDHIGIAFLARVQPGPVTLSGEILESRWFATDALPGPLLPFVQQAIDAAVAHKRSVQR